MAVNADMEAEALAEWERESEGFIDRYGYTAFQVIGATGVAVSVAASFWGGWKFNWAYFMIFCLSILFYIGGARWKLTEMPDDEDATFYDEYYRAKKEHYDMKRQHSEIAQISEERKKHRKDYSGIGEWYRE